LNCRKETFFLNRFYSLESLLNPVPDTLLQHRWKYRPVYPSKFLTH